jgi:hypothetical protein
MSWWKSLLVAIGKAALSAAGEELGKKAKKK